MTGLLSAFAVLRSVLQVVLLWSAVLMAVVAVTDWLVRTRRISPFSPVARFFRDHVDPLLAPVERRVVRYGGLPSSAPWWALAAILIAGILGLAFIDFLGGMLADASRGLSGGPVGILRLVITWAFAVLQVAIIVRVLASWLPVSQFSPWLRWAFTLSEPILRPLRRLIPTIGAIDITPLVAFFGLGILQSLVVGLIQ